MDFTLIYLHVILCQKFLLLSYNKGIRSRYFCFVKMQLKMAHKTYGLHDGK
jgi:hypothetical protein